MLLRVIEQFLRRNDMAATKFGRLAVNDPRLVLDLRNGRTPSAKTEQRVRAFMSGWDAGRVHASPVAQLSGLRKPIQQDAPKRDGSE